MVNVCESALKDREMKLAKVIETPEPKRQQGTEGSLALSLRGQQLPSVHSRHLTQQYFLSGTWKPCISPLSGKLTARKAYGSAGLGSRNKLMPLCNGVDTNPLIRCESRPTSVGSFIAREFVESSLTEESK